MSSNEFNKIAGAVIGAFLLLLLLNFATGMIYDTRETHAGHGEPLGFALAVATDEETGGGQEEQVDYAALLTSADPAKGEKVFNKCKACHAVEDGANRVGPHLWGVVGRDIASAAGFDYSGALAEKEGDWDLVKLSHFLENPKDWAPGTKMNFGGLSKPEDRVNVIAYLNEADGTPIELTAPAPEAETAALDTDAAPVEKVADVPHSQDESGSVENAGKRSGDAVGLTTEVREEKSDTEPEAKEETTSEETKSDESAASKSDESATTDEKADEEKAAAEETSEDKAATDEKADSADTKAEEKPAAAEEKADEEKTEVAAADPKAEDEKSGEAKSEDEKSEGAASEGGDVVIAEAFQGGDVDEGAKVFRKCRACHKVDEGKNGVGPSLYGVVGRKIASVDGFRYSNALQEKEGDWTATNLSEFLKDPKGWAPGTKMKFAGLKKDEDIVNVIHYLNETDGSPDSLE